MSDLEFQRELSPDQIDEALSLLDNAAGGKRGHSPTDELGAGELGADPSGAGEDVDPETGKARATMATQREPSAAADPQQQAKRFNRCAIFFFCLGAAAMATLALLSWSERALTRPSPPAVADRQAPVGQPELPATSASLPLPAANPPSGQIPGRSERGSANEAASGPLPAGAAGADPGKAGTGAAAAAAANQPAVASEPAAADEPAQHKPTEARRHSRSSRIATAKQRPWHSHPPARAEAGRGQCSFFLCLSWQARHVFYEPPRNVNQ